MLVDLDRHPRGERLFQRIEQILQSKQAASGAEIDSYTQDLVNTYKNKPPLTPVPGPVLLF